MVHLRRLPRLAACEDDGIMSLPAIRTKVAEGGRVVIPAEYRRAMGLSVGDEVVLRLEGDELRLTTMDQAIARAQSIVRKYVPEGRSLVDELLAERRREAERA
jgi:AbrB family looped-hinge helix DNA binding protein